MDDSFNMLVPSGRIGRDGFAWWIGQVEGTSALEKNNKGGYRYKVAIVGEHPKSREIVPTADLPWANVMMPVNQPFSPGNITGAASQLTPGCWVVGFYLDNDKQKPIIMGSIGQTPGATTEKNTIQQDDPDSRFATGDRTAPFEIDPKTDGDPSKSDKSKQNGGPSDGTLLEKKDGTKEERVDSGIMKENIKDENWCQDVGQKCEDQDLKGQMKGIMGNFLADIQASDGNIGNYYVSKYTGGLYSAPGVARGYVNKAIYVTREFLSRLKGYIISLLQKGVNKLVKALLRPDEKGNALTGATEWFNGILKDLGCKMEDLGLQLAEWLTNLLMNYVNQIYRAAACQLDELVNGIISKIYQLMNQLLESILGPLQDILGAIAAPLNMIGNAINYILKLLGISCTGVDTTCDGDKRVCTDGAKEGDDDGDFLDRLLESIDNLFGDTPADYTQYVCDEAFTGKPLEITTVGFAGGVPKIGKDTSAPKIIYDINDIEVKEGDLAVFTVTRSGSVEVASSVKIKTLGNQGSATAGKDYLEVDDILGFTQGETEKTIEVQTLIDNETDDNESFFIKMTNNSPDSGGKYDIKFKKNIGKCTISERDLKESYDPFSPTDIDPFEPIEIPDPDGTPTGETAPDDGTPTYQVVANRTTCPEDEFIIYTITTTNIPNGNILYYTLSGEGITNSDIVGQRLTGEFVIQDNEALITVGIREDSTIEDEETLRFTINGTGAFVDVLITAPDDQSISDNDIGVGDDTSTIFQKFRQPIVDSNNVITDGSGGIIEIPVDNTGDAYAEPPVVFVSGEGVGATASALLDENGFVTEIRIQSSGFGYKKNLAVDKNVRCIIDAFTILSPGIGYQSAPKMYINGELGVAEAVVENGFVIGARVLNRTLNFEKFPTIELVGGGGYGARLLPSLVCLDTAALTTVGATKIGTGRYVDCP